MLKFTKVTPKTEMTLVYCGYHPVAIILFNPFSFLAPKRFLDYLVLEVFDLELTWRRLFQIRFMCTC